jgi:hypothetical protein
MIPLTLLAAQKFANILTAGGAVTAAITSLAADSSEIPVISSQQVLLSSATPDVADKNIQCTYPRVCIYSGTLKNTQLEKFRSFSGAIDVQADIWASADMATQTDLWIHYYLEAVTSVLRQNIGDWGDGIFFGGKYDVKLKSPKAGGYGFVQGAAVACSLDASLR